MKTLMLLLVPLFLMNTNFMLFDFDSVEKSGEWYIVNDDVMGGISTSKMTINPEGTATFSGRVSPDNNGGFASVRALINNDPENRYDGVILRLKGDGKKINIRFRTDRNFDGYAYQAKIQTEENVWKEYKVPFKDFEPTFRGMTLTGKPQLESQNIVQMGLLIADKQFGEFVMEVDWISFYN